MGNDGSGILADNDALTRSINNMADAVRDMRHPLLEVSKAFSTFTNFLSSCNDVSNSVGNVFGQLAKSLETFSSSVSSAYNSIVEGSSKAKTEISGLAGDMNKALSNAIPSGKEGDSLFTKDSMLGKLQQMSEGLKQVAGEIDSIKGIGSFDKAAASLKKFSDGYKDFDYFIRNLVNSKSSWGATNIGAVSKNLKQLITTISGSVDEKSISAFHNITGSLKDLASSAKNLKESLQAIPEMGDAERTKINELSNLVIAISKLGAATSDSEQDFQSGFIKMASSLKNLSTAAKTLGDNLQKVPAKSTVKGKLTNLSNLVISVSNLGATAQSEQDAQQGFYKMVSNLRGLSNVAKVLEQNLTKIPESGKISKNIDSLDEIVTTISMIGATAPDADPDIQSRFFKIVSYLKSFSNASKDLSKNLAGIPSKEDLKDKLENLKEFIKSIAQITEEAKKDSSVVEGGEVKYFEGFSNVTSVLKSFNTSISSIGKTLNKINSTKDVLDGIVKKFSEFINKMAELAKSPNYKYFESLANSVQKVSGAAKGLVGATKSVTSSVRAAGNAAEDSSRKFSFLGGSFKQLVNALLGGTAIYKFIQTLREGVKSFVDLEYAMARVNTIAKATPAVLGGWASSMLAIGSATGTEMRQLSEALYNINSATIVGDKALKVLKASAESAVAGYTDINEVATLYAQTINAYGYDVDKVNSIADIYFKTVERGVNPMKDLTQYFGRLLTVSANAGVSLEEISAAIATLTSRGLQTNIAVTSLNSAILKLAGGSKQLNAFFQEVGYSSSAAALSELGLAGVMEILKEKTNGSTAALRQLGFNERNIRAVTTLASENIKEFARNLEYMKEGTGGSVTFKAMMESLDTIQGRWNQFKAIVVEAIQKIYAALGGSERVKSILLSLSSVVKSLGNVFVYIANSPILSFFAKVIVYGKLATTAYSRLGAVLGKNLFGNVIKSVATLTKAWVANRVAMLRSKDGVHGVAHSMRALKVAVNGVNVSVKALGVTLKTVLIETVVGAVIVVIGELIGWLMSLRDKMKEIEGYKDRIAKLQNRAKIGFVNEEAMEQYKAELASLKEELQLSPDMYKEVESVFLKLIDESEKAYDKFKKSTQVVAEDVIKEFQKMANKVSPIIQKMLDISGSIETPELDYKNAVKNISTAFTAAFTSEEEVYVGILTQNESYVKKYGESVKNTADAIEGLKNIGESIIEENGIADKFKAFTYTNNSLNAANDKLKHLLAERADIIKRLEALSGYSEARARRARYAEEFYKIETEIQGTQQSIQKMEKDLGPVSDAFKKAKDELLETAKELQLKTERVPAKFFELLDKNDLNGAVKLLSQTNVALSEISSRSSELYDNLVKMSKLRNSAGLGFLNTDALIKGSLAGKGGAEDELRYLRAELDAVINDFSTDLFGEVAGRRKVADEVYDTYTNKLEELRSKGVSGTELTKEMDKWFILTYKYLGFESEEQLRKVVHLRTKIHNEVIKEEKTFADRLKGALKNVVSAFNTPELKSIDDYLTRMQRLYTKLKKDTGLDVKIPADMLNQFKNFVEDLREKGFGDDEIADELDKLLDKTYKGMSVKQKAAIAEYALGYKQGFDSITKIIDANIKKIDDVIEEGFLSGLSDTSKFQVFLGKFTSLYDYMIEDIDKITEENVSDLMGQYKELLSLISGAAVVKLPDTIKSTQAIQSGTKEAYDIFAKVAYGEKYSVDKEMLGVQQEIRNGVSDLLKQLRERKNELKVTTAT